MRGWVLVTVLCVACSKGRPPEGGTPEQAAVYCEQLRQDNPGCFQPEDLDDCETVYEECGERLEIVQDCPIVVDCP